MGVQGNDADLVAKPSARLSAAERCNTQCCCRSQRTRHTTCRTTDKYRTLSKQLLQSRHGSLRCACTLAALHTSTAQCRSLRCLAPVGGRCVLSVLIRSHTVLYYAIVTDRWSLLRNVTLRAAERVVADFADGFAAGAHK